MLLHSWRGTDDDDASRQRRCVPLREFVVVATDWLCAMRLSGRDRIARDAYEKVLSRVRVVRRAWLSAFTRARA